MVRQRMNKHGRRDDRVGGEKREMEGNGSIYMMTSAIGGARVRHLPGCACHTTPSSRHYPFPFLSAVSTCTIVDWIGDLLPPFPALLTLLFPALCFCLGHDLPLSSDIFTSAPHATANQTSPITSSNPHLRSSDPRTSHSESQDASSPHLIFLPHLPLPVSSSVFPAFTWPPCASSRLPRVSSGQSALDSACQ